MYVQLTSNNRTANLFLLSLVKPKGHRSIINTPQGPVEPETQNILARKAKWCKNLSATEIADALTQRDPEIAPERAGEPIPIGRPVDLKSTVFLNEAGEPVHHFNVVEEKYSPDGILKETKPYKPSESNVEIPITTMAKGGQKAEDLPFKFVVHRVYQLIHTDTLSYDFLFNLCKSISEQGYIRLGAGIKGNEPLVLRREGLPAIAYLRGRVEGDKYIATLHLTNRELKRPAAMIAAAATAAAAASAVPTPASPTTETTIVPTREMPAETPPTQAPAKKPRRKAKPDVEPAALPPQNAQAQALAA